MRAPFLWALWAVAFVSSCEVVLAQHEQRPKPEQIATWIKQLQDESSEVRLEAAENLATCDGDEILPAILEREKVEQESHVRLALAYARAGHGDRQAVEILIDSLKGTGHFGYIYLRRLARADLNWDQDKWRQWLKSKSDSDFKQLADRHRLPTSERYGGRQELDEAKVFLHEKGDLLQAVEMLRDVVEQFPRSEYGIEAQELADQLDVQAQEWREYERKARKPLSQRSARERADELVFLLRTQQGVQFSTKGRCDIFWDPRREESPAALLVSMGFDAVPSLIDALEDRQPTRSIGGGLGYVHLLRVEDCALQVLERIAGKSLEKWDRDRGIDFAATKEYVEAWWLKAQTEGEQAYIERIVKKGGRNSPEMAKLLAARYPEAVLGAIREGIANAESDSVRVSFVWLLDDLPDNRGLELLKHLAAEGKTRATRVKAAMRLGRRGLLDPVPIFIHEWQTNQQQPGGDPSSREAVSFLVGYLAGSNSPEGVAALADGVMKRSSQERFCIVLATLPDPGGQYSFSGACMVPEMPPKTAASPETQAEIEWLLVDLLEDTEAHEVTVQWGGIKVNHPRTCDVAAKALALRFPEKYKFDLQAAADERERSLVVIKNTWRAGRGEPALPLPEVREVAIVSTEVVQPLIDKLSQATDPDAHREALAQLESLGIGALGSLETLQKDKDLPSQVRDDLATIATRLGNCVERIEWTRRSADPGDELRKRFEGLLHKPLSAEAIIAIYRDVIRSDPAGPSVVDLVVVRPTGKKGVEVSIDLFKPSSPAAEAAIGWDYEFSFVADGEGLGSTNGYSARDYLEGPEGFKHFTEQFNKLLALPPNTSYQAKLVFGRAD